MWVAIVVFFALIQQLTEPFLIDHSYRIFIRENSDILKEIDNILMKSQGDISISGDSVFCKGEQFSANEIRTLKEGKERLGVYQIYKFDKGIYYGLWGFLKVRLGITYLPGGGEPTKQYRHLTENWFR